jgi:predicted small secreted protein
MIATGIGIVIGVIGTHTSDHIMRDLPKRHSLVSLSIFKKKKKKVRWKDVYIEYEKNKNKDDYQRRVFDGGVGIQEGWKGDKKQRSSTRRGNGKKKI